ncbi:MAG TPA: hypothetical protein VFE86_07930, partial [Ilumatobacteraceae bacterium]|nr:hypothetical protein [Ilumatobacteraceae bacterium]
KAGVAKNRTARRTNCEPDRASIATNGSQSIGSAHRGHDLGAKGRSPPLVVADAWRPDRRSLQVV